MILDILTINLWGLPWPAARDRVQRKHRFREHIRDAAYHLVGIQELWWPWRRSLEDEVMVVPRTARDSGLALAGRLRAEGEPRVRHFHAHAGIDRLKHKGLLSARMPLDHGFQLAVHVTHLQAGRRHAGVRARQVDEILAHVAGDGRPAVLMGDFNFYRDQALDHASCERLRAHGFADVAEASPSATYTSSNRYARRGDCDQRFDRVFLRSSAAVRLRATAVEVLGALAEPLSDHHPLRVRVHVES